MPGSLGDLMMTNGPEPWEGGAQTCRTVLFHPEHLGQDRRDTKIPMGHHPPHETSLKSAAHNNKCKPSGSPFRAAHAI